jgi:hypothetical protein
VELWNFVTILHHNLPGLWSSASTLLRGAIYKPLTVCPLPHLLSNHTIEGKDKKSHTKETKFLEGIKSIDGCKIIIPTVLKCECVHGNTHTHTHTECF